MSCLDYELTPSAQPRLAWGCQQVDALCRTLGNNKHIDVTQAQDRRYFVHYAEALRAVWPDPLPLGTP